MYLKPRSCKFQIASQNAAAISLLHYNFWDVGSSLNEAKRLLQLHFTRRTYLMYTCSIGLPANDTLPQLSYIFFANINTVSASSLQRDSDHL